MKFALKLARHGKVPPPVPPHVADKVDEARALHKVVNEQGRHGYAGIVQGEHALAKLDYHLQDEDDESTTGQAD
jgi:hypothetical protein